MKSKILTAFAAIIMVHGANGQVTIDPPLVSATCEVGYIGGVESNVQEDQTDTATCQAAFVENLNLSEGSADTTISAPGNGSVAISVASYDEVNGGLLVDSVARAIYKRTITNLSADNFNFTVAVTANYNFNITVPYSAGPQVNLTVLKDGSLLERDFATFTDVGSGSGSLTLEVNVPDIAPGETAEILTSVRAYSTVNFVSFYPEPTTIDATFQVDYSFDESDADSDGVSDDIDNCINASNAGQLDSDGDDYGNACDADFNQDCLTNFLDVGLFAAQFMGTNPIYDLNGDGNVNFLDYPVVVNGIFMPPGPSGLTTLCN